jgi:hypothetical protein
MFCASRFYDRPDALITGGGTASFRPSIRSGQKTPSRLSEVGDADTKGTCWFLPNFTVDAILCNGTGILDIHSSGGRVGAHPPRPCQQWMVWAGLLRQEETRVGNQVDSATPQAHPAVQLVAIDGKR